MPIARGRAAAAGTSPLGGFFGALSKGIREEKTRRDKTDEQLIEAMSVLEQIEKRGEETRKTQRAKPLTRQQQAFASASRGEALPGFSIEETKRLAGAGKTGTQINILDTLRGLRGGDIGAGITAPKGRVRVRRKSDKKEFTIPANQLEQALAGDFERVQ